MNTDFLQQLTAEFAAANPDKTFLTDYDASAPYLKKLEVHLADLYAQHPANADVVCMLAAARMECREPEEDCARLLEDFLAANESTLSAQEKARIFTNLGFYHEGDEPKRAHYLQLAAQLDSPYPQTFKGLGLVNFAGSLDAASNLEASVEAFARAHAMTGEYEFAFDQGVALYAAKRFAEAAEVFQALLADFPDRPRLLLALAYCRVGAGERESALELLARVEAAPAQAYSLNCDEVDPLEIYDAYYALGDYARFLAGYDKVLSEYSLFTWDHYLYALWATGQRERYAATVARLIEEEEQEIAQSRTSPDFEDESEREEWIAACQKSLDDVRCVASRIEAGDYRPEVELNLYPEYGCFLVDCLRHGN
ncbi:MAG: tetratricopeptide repeat protein [Buchananella hordeovulneris]|nr:tetratricopeptide repeat protein [Buchananella hordeovulneris]